MEQVGLSTPSMNSARYNFGSSGTQTSAMGFGGYAPGSPPAARYVNTSENIMEQVGHLLQV
jgi:hypothetical protein